MKPLAQTTVLITRPKNLCRPMAQRLRRRGARVLIAPTIRTVAPRSWKTVDAALEVLESYDSILFTSANAAARFLNRRPSIARRIKAAGIKVYAIGPATARALSVRGVRGTTVSRVHEGAALARRLGAVRGKRILIPRAQQAREVLPRILRSAGARVTVAPCYRTVPDPAGLKILRRALQNGSVDWVTFTSASTVNCFADGLGRSMLGRIPSRTRFASIGPVTTSALKRRGLTPAIEAKSHTSDSLVDEIVNHSRPVPEADLERTLRRALREAGVLARKYFGKVKPHYKGRFNIVTKADLACEQRILDIILKRFPDHDFLTEERAPKNTGSDYTWIVDPIDGTNNYAHTYPVCCVSIAVSRRGVTLIGGIYDPFKDELFLARRGRGATLNGRRITVSKNGRLNNSLLMTGFPYDRTRRAKFYLDICSHFLRRCHGLRRSGSAALDLAWTAAGRVDGYWEFALNPWDFAAGALLVREAGGHVTDFKGRPFGNPKDSGPATLATNGRIHKAMLALLLGKK